MNISVRLDNGETITAPSEEWVAAILTRLPQDQRVMIFDSVRKKAIFYSTPGTFILKAEAGLLGASLGAKR